MRLASIFWSGEDKSSSRSKNLIARKESDWIEDVPTRRNTVESRTAHGCSRRDDVSEIREDNADFPVVYRGPYEDMMACSGSVGESIAETQQHHRVIKVNPPQNENDNEPQGCLVDFVLNEQLLIHEAIHKNAVAAEKGRGESDELDVSRDRKAFDPLSIPIPMKSLVLGDKYTYNDYAKFAARGINEMKTVLRQNALKDYAKTASWGFNEMKTVLRRNDCNGNELIDILADWDGGETFTYDSSLSDSFDRVMQDPLYSLDSCEYTIESGLSGVSQFGSLPLLNSSNGSTFTDVESYQDEVEVTLSGIKPGSECCEDTEDSPEIALTTTSSIGFQDHIEVTVSGFQNNTERTKEIQPRCIAADESSCSSNGFLGVVDASDIKTTQKEEPEVAFTTIDNSKSTVESVCSVATEGAEEKSSDTCIEDKPRRIAVLKSFFRTVIEKRARATKPRSYSVMKSDAQEEVILKESESVNPTAGATIESKSYVQEDVIPEDSAKRYEQTASVNNASLTCFLEEEPTTDVTVGISHNHLEEPIAMLSEVAVTQGPVPGEEQLQLETVVLESGNLELSERVDIHLREKIPEQLKSLDDNITEMNKNAVVTQSDEAEEHADQMELIQPTTSVVPAEGPNQPTKQDLTGQNNHNDNMIISQHSSNADQVELIQPTTSVATAETTNEPTKQDLTDQKDDYDMMNISQRSSNASIGRVAEAKSVNELTHDKSSEANKSSDDETYVYATKEELALLMESLSNESTETECSKKRAEAIELAQNLDWSAFVQEGLKSRSVSSAAMQSAVQSPSPNSPSFSPPTNRSASSISSQSDKTIPTKVSMVKSFFGKVIKKNYLKKNRSKRNVTFA